MEGEEGGEGEDGEEDEESGDRSAEGDEPSQGQHRRESSGGSAAQMTKRRAGLRPWLKITEGLT